MHNELGIDGLFFEQDCEPVWTVRDEAVKNWCRVQNITCVEKVGHTLWNPVEIIRANGGSPPVTFRMFNFVAKSIGKPDSPLNDDDLDLNRVPFMSLRSDFGGLLQGVPENPEWFGIHAKNEVRKVYKGGEKVACKLLARRLIAYAAY